MKKFLCVISAVITALFCSVTAFAESQSYNAVIVNDNDNYIIKNVLYDGGRFLVFESSKGSLDGKVTNKRYDFSINYIILHHDGIVTPEWFGLSDEYTIEQTAYDDKTETYTVNVETQEELDKLYETSSELLEKGTVENVYKQFTYEYACLQSPLRAYITLNETDKNFNLNSIDGLENITLQQDSENPVIYYYDCTIEDCIAFEKASETIRTTENVKDFRFLLCACVLWHSPNTIRIYANEYERTILKGDANDDTVLNARDCSYIARNIAAGTIDQIEGNADFNEDGKVNIRDAASIAVKLSEYK